MAELTSRQIGKYQIQAELGRGGFGSVYRAYDPTVGRLVAIKVLTASGDQSLLTRFKNEAAAAGNLRHKNIITIYDFGDHEGLPYIVMEFLEGEDLQQVISQHKPLTLLQKASIMLQVADGLHCAHRSGVVHRDVKPGNIRLLPDGTVKIMDFGIARLVEGGAGAATRLTRQGHVIGTLLYMAPEQVRGGEVDFLCDIFAYGITFYELLAGKHPFQGSDPRTVFYRLTSEDPEPIRNIVPECPEALEAILNRTLHKERELRYQSLREVQLDMEPILIELRQERATQLVSEASRLYERGQLDSAQAVLSEAFDLDPGNRDARQLRETIQSKLMRRVIEPKVDALLKEGESQIAERQFPEAIVSYEAALRLDRDNPEIKERLKRARELLNISRESARKVADAKREVSRNNLDAALQTLPETLEMDPGNPDVRQLLQDIRLEVERRDRDRLLEKKMQKVKDLLQANRFDEAIDALKLIEEGDRLREEFIKLAAQVKDQKHAHDRQQNFHEELGAARELLAADQYEAAIPPLERLMNKYPEEPEATKLFIAAHKKLAAQRKSAALQNLGIELGHFLEARQFDRALEAVNEALREYPAEQRLLDSIRHIEAEQKKHRQSEAVREALEKAQASAAQGLPEAAVQVLEAAIVRLPGEARLDKALSDARLLVQQKQSDQAIDALCRDADAQLERREFDRALSAIDQGLRAHGQDPRLAGAREKVIHAKLQWERSEAIRQALQDSERLIGANQPEQAVETLEKVLSRYPGEESLTTAMALARQAADAKRREQAIVSLSRDAASQLANRDFDGALNGVDQGISAFGQDSRLTALRENILTAKAAWERTETVRIALEECGQSLARNDPNSAVRVLEAAAQRYPDESRLSGALANARKAADDKRRADAIEQVCGETDGRLLKREFDDALAGVEQALQSFAGEARLTRLRDQIVSAKADWERTETVRKAIEDSRQSLENDDPERAVQALDAALQRYPREEQLTYAAKQARQALSRKQREQAIQASLQQAGSDSGNQEFDRALAAIDQAIEAHGADGRLTDLRDRIALAKADWEQEEHVRRTLQDSDRRLNAGDPESAVRVLEEALGRYPREERLSQALARAHGALESLRRETAIQGCCRDSGGQLERGEFDRALEGIEQGIRTFGDDDRLVNLRGRIASARDEWRRTETVRTALEQSSRLLSEGDPEAAVQALETALAQYPDESSLETATAAARQARETKRRENAIEAACREAGSQLEGREFDRALAVLDQAIEAHGPDQRLAAMRDRVATAKSSWEREEATQQAVMESQSRLSRDDPDGALQAIEAALARYPDDETLLSAAASASEALEAKRRNAAIEGVCQSAAAKSERQEFDEALDEIAHGIADYGADQRLVALQQKTAAAKSDWQRRESIRAVLQDCQQALAKGEPKVALQLLEEALKQYPDEAQLLAAVSNAQQALEAKNRAAAIQKTTKQVRQLLKNQQFHKALAAVDQELQNYPGDPSLTELRDQVAAATEEWDREQSVRQALSRAAELQGKNRVADALQALRQVLDKYPGEPRLTTAFQEIEGDFKRQQREESLRATLEQVEQLLAQDPDKARRMLEAALSENPGDPRVTAALENAKQLCQARQRDESIDAVCRETRVFLQSLEFAPALDTIEKSLQTFGHEPRLAQMRETVIASKSDFERAEGIRQAVEDASRYASQGQLETAVESLLTATKIFGPVDRLNEALNATKAAIDKKRRQEEIERLCGQTQAELDAQRLDNAARLLAEAEHAHGTAPEFAALHQRLNTARARQERERAVSHAIEEINRFVAQGALDRAVQAADAALAQFAGETRLVAIRSQAVQAREAKRKDEAIERICGEIRAILQRKEFKAALKKINQAQKTHGSDPRFDQVRTELAAAKIASERRSPAAAPPAEAAAPDLGRAAAPAPILPVSDTKKNPWVLRIAAGVVVVATAGGLLWLSGYGRGTKTVRLEVKASPANASVKVENQTCTNGDCGFDLKPGVYQVRVSADGYQSATQEARLTLGTEPPAIAVALRPLNPTVQVAANFVQGQVALDGKTAGRLLDGQFALDGLQPGKHVLRISGSDYAATLAFETDFAKTPVLGSISADGVDEVAVGSFGNQATVSCSACSGTASVDDRPAGEIRNGTSTISSLSAGTHRLNLNSQSGERSMVFLVGGVPSINLALTSNRNYGTLVVDAGEDGVSVFIDGQRYSRTTVRGQIRTPVEAKEHTVRVAKNGFRAEPAEFRASVAKGGQVEARFRLTREPARLLITDGAPGASVSVDGRTVGTVAPDGSFSTEVPPGKHQIAFAHEGFSPSEISRDFSAGRPVQLSKAEVQLNPLPPPKAPPKAPPKTIPVEPPRPDPAAVELADWQRVVRNPSVADVADFLQKHPGGANAPEAQRLLERLEWDATNRNSKTALQQFLSRYGDGSHAQEARSLLAGIEKLEADELTAAQRAKDQATRTANDLQAVSGALKAFEDAYNRRDLAQLQQLWNPMPKNIVESYRNQFREAKALAFHMKPTGAPSLNGDTATVICTRTLSFTARSGDRPPETNERVRVTLERTGSTWAIRSITPF
jgi:serine/threonine-protein kinase